MEDMPAVVAMYGAVIRAMRGTTADIDWDLSYHPTPEGLARAAEAGELLVAVAPDGVVLGAGVVNGSQEPDYALASWGVDASDAEVATLHLLAVAPEARGAGVGRALLAAAADLARARGARALRLDVFDNNECAVKAYLACGFVDCGRFELHYSEGFVHGAHLMELVL